MFFTKGGYILQQKDSRMKISFHSVLDKISLLIRQDPVSQGALSINCARLQIPLRIKIETLPSK